jgi:hypothetical protein
MGREVEAWVSSREYFISIEWKDSHEEMGGDFGKVGLA